MLVWASAASFPAGAESPVPSPTPGSCPVSRRDHSHRHLPWPLCPPQRQLPTAPRPATKLMSVEVRWLCVGCELRQGSLTSLPGTCPAAQALETAQRGKSDSEAHPASPQAGRPASDSPRAPPAPVSQCSGRAGAGPQQRSPPRPFVCRGRCVWGGGAGW